jgi:hypothetical protein
MAAYRKQLGPLILATNCDWAWVEHGSKERFEQKSLIRKSRQKAAVEV